ncbi:MAG: outer membrane beta-barrel protein [Dokdonella sp.]|uniref:outer membrane beta-barrel protein n=1 Tax=Dokdonella sp. TaxID=2291710 RepID=UPI0025C5735C|nr:outer membrane beta-barrel protein [Dokdonella sp.]MBX3700707.1 outer membrane beta-barrel protein [Dokdonella sp.]
MRIPVRGPLALAAALCAASAPALHAQSAFNYSLGIELERNDNINLSRDNPVGATVLTPTLAFDLQQQGAVLTASAAGSLSWRDYLDGPFSDELRGLFAGTGVWAISPGRLDWVAEDYLGRQPINVLQVDVPTNQQQTNVFSTGPTLHLHLREDLQGRLDLRYTNTYAEKTGEFDSSRLSALAQLAWLLSPGDTLAASLGSSRVRYDRQVSQPFDYDRNDAYLGYTHATDAIKLESVAGYSWLDLRAAGQHNGSLLKLALRWMPSPATDLGVSAVRQIADASQDLIVDPTALGDLGIGSGRNGAVISPQLYVEKRIDLDFNHREARWSIALAPFWRQLDYIDGALLSQHSLGWTASVDWRLRPNLTLSASTGRERRDYRDMDRVDTDLTSSVVLQWRRTSHWLWQLRATHARRDSTLRAAGYRDNAIILSLAYTR